MISLAENKYIIFGCSEIDIIKNAVKIL